MSATLIIARHAVQESVRRRVFAVVLLLTVLFLALFTIASIKAFAGPAPFMFGSGGLINPSQVTSITSVTLLSLGVFASLFLATVLAVFLTLGAVRGDAERGLKPLVVRPLGRSELLLGRFAGAAAVCISYTTILYGAVVLIVHQAGGQWPDHIAGPAVALAAAITILVAMSLLGSVLLSATANGIAIFMLCGAGLISGLLATIGAILARTPFKPSPTIWRSPSPSKASTKQRCTRSDQTRPASRRPWSTSAHSAPRTQPAQPSTSAQPAISPSPRS
jgi:ABC-type transport system involved in multi-copper enzyme maturation permease subunit